MASQYMQRFELDVVQSSVHIDFSVEVSIFSSCGQEELFKHSNSSVIGKKKSYNQVIIAQ